MTQLIDCWKLVEIREVHQLIMKWYHTKNRWALTKKGKKEIKLSEEVASQRVASAIRFHYPELKDKSVSWTIRFARDRNYTFIKEGYHDGND